MDRQRGPHRAAKGSICHFLLFPLEPAPGGQVRGAGQVIVGYSTPFYGLATTDSRKKSERVEGESPTPAQLAGRGEGEGTHGGNGSGHTVCAGSDAPPCQHPAAKHTLHLPSLPFAARTSARLEAAPEPLSSPPKDASDAAACRERASRLESRRTLGQLQPVPSPR